MKPVPTPLSSNPSMVPVKAETQPDAVRRRFLIGGLVAAPLLVTLMAKPAWATPAGAQGSLGNYGSATP